MKKSEKSSVCMGTCSYEDLVEHFFGDNNISTEFQAKHPLLTTAFQEQIR